ncbi:uncharacterized protein B0I36DRAFT_349740 [Microdochium trichocladiopsis]|uniref:Uncharacterized protein n=1 Tax=Microdochium trichocladiopsis TaxID=1682393 RepID=A0A9P8Y7H8_9PEZI|nr:uncharacterized protein B0I36DRAFT_349740 [Microdochium trichocladiopsis]KAH7031704.1 hypothetical protein B0I36DRAFT_349740 [Microdochium trichocladiopsis]
MSSELLGKIAEIAQTDQSAISISEGPGSTSMVRATAGADTLGKVPELDERRVMQNALERVLRDNVARRVRGFEEVQTTPATHAEAERVDEKLQGLVRENLRAPTPRAGRPSAFVTLVSTWTAPQMVKGLYFWGRASSFDTNDPNGHALRLGDAFGPRGHSHDLSKLFQHAYDEVAQKKNHPINPNVREN